VLAVASQALAQPSQVILIRHAEKPMSGNELSPQGRERAAALVPFFLGTDELLEFNTPAAIYAQSQKKETSSIRSIETVKPLAEALQLRINKTSARDEFQQLVKETVANDDNERDTGLIYSEQNVSIEIAKEFSVGETPTKWRGTMHSRVRLISSIRVRGPVSTTCPTSGYVTTRMIDD
jgi:hypothetical protein